MKRLAILLLVGSVNACFALTIDDFTTGPDDARITSGSRVEFQGGSMIGGERDVELRVLNNPFVQALEYTIGSGFAIVSDGFGLESRVTLQYDGVGDETYGGTNLHDGPGFNPTNLTGQDRFVLSFVGNDLPLDLGVRVESANGHASSTVMHLGSNAGVVNVLFSTFTGNADFAAITKMQFTFEPLASGDYALGSIKAVPEPATIAIVALGLTSLLLRRRTLKT